VRKRKKYLEKVKRIVVKIGSNSLTTEKGINEKKIKKLSDELTTVYKSGIQVLLVSSGAIAGGIKELGLKGKPATIPEKQAIASIGQRLLISLYHKYLSRNKIITAQILLTAEDLRNRQRHLNVKNTLITLLKKYKTIPIINENDAVAIDEIVFGDNDILAALVSCLIDADLLIFLTDTEGFYIEKRNERILLNEVEKIDNTIKKFAEESGSSVGTGGMKSKIEGARIATSAGIPVIIASSKKDEIIQKILSGEKVGTFFYPSPRRLKSRKRWLAFFSKPSGKIFIDSGAEKALKEGKSLLPVGIIKVEGKFKKGDTLEIYNHKNILIGKGVTNYSSFLIEKIKGLKSSEVKKIVGDKFYDEVIHRDNLTLHWF